MGAGSCARSKVKVLAQGQDESGTILAIKTSSLVREADLGSINHRQVQLSKYVQGTVMIKRKEWLTLFGGPLGEGFLEDFAKEKVI